MFYIGFHIVNIKIPEYAKRDKGVARLEGRLLLS